VSEVHLVMLEYLGAAQSQDMYFLLDFSETHAPSGLLSLPSLLQVINHANTRWLVIVKPASMFSSMTQLLSRDKVKIMRERQAGLEFLAGMVRLDTGQQLSLKA
jgi:hypothetical protein